MKGLNLTLDEYDLLYILNCIALTRNLLYKGDKEQFGTYLKKEDYTELNWNLWLLQKRLVIGGNKAIYNSERIDMSWAQLIYFREKKDLNCFSLNIKEHQKEIADFENAIQQVKKINKDKNKISYFKSLWLFKKIS